MTELKRVLVVDDESDLLATCERLLAVSGYLSDQVRRAALDAGATGFFAKPFAAAGLLAAITASLR